LGALGLALGVSQGVKALQLKERLDRACDGKNCPATENAEIRSFKRARTLSTVGYVAGAATLVGGGFVLWRNAHGSTGEVQVGYGHAYLRGRF
jgi:hypothetical protein